MPKNSFADESFEWSQLLVSVKNNEEDVAYLEELTSELRIIVNASRALEIERLALDAKSQQLTRDMQALRGRGRVVAARVRAGLKTRYGYGSEKLIEFGIQPRRRSIMDEKAEQAAVAKLSDPESIS